MPAEALIIQLTDLHLPGDPHALYRDVSIAERLQRLKTEIQLRYGQPDLLLLTGDLTNHGDIDTYQWLAAQVQGVAQQCCWLPGNHDDAALMQRIPEARSLWQKVMHLAGWQIIALDSTAQPDGKGRGNLADAELALLRQQLRHNAAPALITLHHNPLATGSGWQDPIMLGNAEAFWQLLAEYPQVRAVLHGHLHHAFEHQYQGIAVLGSPAVAPQFLPQQADFTLDNRNGFCGPALRWLKLQLGGVLETDIVRLADDC